MKILITGGAGYLGSVITKKMLGAGHSVTAIDNLSFKQLSPLQFTSNPNYNFIYGDVRNVDFLKHQVGIHDVIIPLAAIVGFPACKADPKLAWEVNFTQIETVLDVDRALWMLAFNNVLVNLDSYSGAFRQNYYLYKDQNDRFDPIVWDLNMSFAGFPGGTGGGAYTATTLDPMSNSTSR